MSDPSIEDSLTASLNQVEELTVEIVRTDEETASINRTQDLTVDLEENYL